MKKSLIEMTNLVDVIFLTLIFFMVSTTFSKQATRETSINVKLPQSSVKETQETTEIIVTVTRTKDIYINSIKVSFQGFRPALQEALHLASKANVIIRGDTKTLIMDLLFGL